jgi:hypothetical protein
MLEESLSQWWSNILNLNVYAPIECRVCKTDAKEPILGYIVTRYGIVCSKCFDYGRSLVFSCCDGKGTANWDQNNQRWRCSDCGATQSTDPTYLGGGFKPASPDKQITSGGCICGGEIAKTTHAFWCNIKN